MTPEDARLIVKATGKEQAAMSGAYADDRAIAQLLIAYEAADNCQYRFCGGMGQSGNRIVSMMTCSTCQARIYLRRALKRMGIDPDNYQPRVKL
jgi:hypothetical protein